MSKTHVRKVKSKRSPAKHGAGWPQDKLPLGESVHQTLLVERNTWPFSGTHMAYVQLICSIFSMFSHVYLVYPSLPTTSHNIQSRHMTVIQIHISTVHARHMHAVVSKDMDQLGRKSASRNFCQQTALAQGQELRPWQRKPKGTQPNLFEHLFCSLRAALAYVWGSLDVVSCLTLLVNYNISPTRNKVFGGLLPT